MLCLLEFFYSVDPKRYTSVRDTDGKFVAISVVLLLCSIGWEAAVWLLPLDCSFTSHYFAGASSLHICCLVVACGPQNREWAATAKMASSKSLWQYWSQPCLLRFRISAITGDIIRVSACRYSTIDWLCRSGFSSSADATRGIIILCFLHLLSHCTRAITVSLHLARGLIRATIS